MRYEKIKINTVMKRLTKEIAEKIRNKYNITDFYTFGVVRGYEFYLGIYNHGGKTGFPFVFTINDNDEIIRITDWGTYGIIRRTNNLLEQVEI